MTYQLDITHYRPSINDSRLWLYAKIFLPIMFLSTSAEIFYFNLPVLFLLNVVLGLIFLAIIIKLSINRHRVHFVKIEDGTLNYFNPQDEEMVSVRINEITHISSTFCALHVHTNNQIHTLDLGLIRNEKTRWEIKDMIKKMACGDSGMLAAS